VTQVERLADGGRHAVLQVQVLQASGERDFDAAFATLRIKTIRKVVVRGLASPTILKVATGRGDSVAYG
jgi:hypothetical protein